MTEEPPKVIAGIPQSSALAEASTESLDFLMSMDPFGYLNNRQSRDKIVAGLREQRARFEAAEAAVASGSAKTVRSAKAQLSAKSTAKAEDLGL